MDAVLSTLGVGALLAWVVLPIFAWLIRPRVRADAGSLHRAQLAVLLSAVAVLLVPWLPALPSWLVPSAPYYQFEMRAIIAPTATPMRFVPREAAAVMSPISIVGLAWLLAVAFAAARTALGVRAVARILREASPAPAALVEVLRASAAALQLRRVPALIVSERTAIPFATGLWQPTIVLPNELLDTLEPAALELVLEHELEHVRRADVRSAALVTLLKIVLGGHPTADRIAREAVLAREIAVDARVSRASPRAYATLLVDIAAHAHFGEKPATTAIDDTALARRIALISEPVALRPLPLLPLVAAATALVLVALLARTLVSWSHEPKDFHVAVFPGPGSRAMVFGAHASALGVGRPPPGMRLAAPPLALPPPGPPLPEIIRQSQELRACYADAAKSEPGLTLHTFIAVDADESGVPRASVMAPSAPKLAACLERELQPLLRKLDLPSRANFTIGLELAPDLLP